MDRKCRNRAVLLIGTLMAVSLVWKSPGALGTEDPLNVAIVSINQGNYADAIPMLEQGIASATLPRDQARVVEMTRLLAGCYGSQDWAKAAGLEVVPHDSLQLGSPIHFADLKLDELTAVPAFFLLAGPKGLSVEALVSLIACNYQPIILFTISPVIFHIDASNRWYHESRLFISIEQLFSFADDGRLAVSKKLRTTIQEFAERMSAASKGEQVRSAHTDSVFQALNDYHTVILHGKELPHLTPLQADVARILHQAHLQGQRDVKYAAIACKIADLHADERGFEPPAKMSQIFRSGDARSQLLSSPKPGYYRLNI